MKTKEELNALKNDIEALNRKQKNMLTFYFHQDIIRKKSKDNPFILVSEALPDRD